MTSKIWRRIAMAAALGMIALNTVGGAWAGQVTAVLPEAKEFREGDRWNAHVPGVNAHVGMIKQNGRFTTEDHYSLDDYLKLGTPGNRSFTDLDGTDPKFPAEHSRLFAAPDGTLYAFAGGIWHRVKIGDSFSTILGPISITERMTQLQADVMSLELRRRAEKAKEMAGINQTVLRPMITTAAGKLQIKSGVTLPTGNSPLDRDLRENMQLGNAGQGLQHVPVAVRRISNARDQHEQLKHDDAAAQPYPASQLSTRDRLTEMAVRAAARSVIIGAVRTIVLR
jgi:hypothetical protein